jgi:hypothetical protein
MSDEEAAVSAAASDSSSAAAPATADDQVDRDIFRSETGELRRQIARLTPELPATRARRATGLPILQWRE